VFAAVAGAGIELVNPQAFGLVSVAVLAATLAVQAVLFRDVGRAFDSVEGIRDFVVGVLLAVPSMLGIYVVFGLGLLGIVFVAILPGLLGRIPVFPAVVLWRLYLILAFPAVCIDKHALCGLNAGWEYGKQARLSLFAIFLFLGLPVAGLHNVMTDVGTTTAIVTLVVLWGCLLTIVNLALARISVSFREQDVERARHRSNRRQPSSS